MNIVLTGFMASGKTTAGRKIAELSRYEFIDTDEMIERREGRRISEIFAAEGEEYFRRVESEIIREAAAMDMKVISTGGGAVLNPANIDELRKNGVIFNLAPEFSVIERRVERAAASRPLMKGQDIDAIRKRFYDREPFYKNCDYRIRITDGAVPEETAARVLEIMNG